MTGGLGSPPRGSAATSRISAGSDRMPAVGQRRVVAGEPVAAREPLLRAGDHADAAVPELEQVGGDARGRRRRARRTPTAMSRGGGVRGSTTTNGNPRRRRAEQLRGRSRAAGQDRAGEPRAPGSAPAGGWSCDDSPASRMDRPVRAGAASRRPTRRSGRSSRSARRGSGRRPARCAGRASRRGAGRRGPRAAMARLDAVAGVRARRCACPLSTRETVAMETPVVRRDLRARCSCAVGICYIACFIAQHADQRATSGHGESDTGDSSVLQSVSSAVSPWTSRSTRSAR